MVPFFEPQPYGSMPGGKAGRRVRGGAVRDVLRGEARGLQLRRDLCDEPAAGRLGAFKAASSPLGVALVFFLVHDVHHVAL